MSYAYDKELWKGVRVFMCAVYYSHNVDRPHAMDMMNFMMDAKQLIESGQLVLRIDDGQPLDYYRSTHAHFAVYSNHQFTHAFFFDPDMQITLEHLERLLAWGVPVVSGTYFKAGAAVQPQSAADGEIPDPPAAARDEGTTGQAPRICTCVASRDRVFIHRNEIEAYRREDALLPVHVTGAGCLLVERRVLQAVGQPAFKMNWEVGPAHRSIQYEDGWFCERVRRAGFPVFIDPAVQPAHYKMVRIGHDIKDLNSHTIATINEGVSPWHSEQAPTLPTSNAGSARATACTSRRPTPQARPLPQATAPSGPRSATSKA